MEKKLKEGEHNCVVNRSCSRELLTTARRTKNGTYITFLYVSRPSGNELQLARLGRTSDDVELEVRWDGPSVDLLLKPCLPYVSYKQATACQTTLDKPQCGLIER